MDGIRKTAFVAMITSFAAMEADAAILLQDSFDRSGTVDAGTWSVPPAPESFYGRTQANLLELPAMEEGSLKLRLDPYNPFDAGRSFYGADILSRQEFVPGIVINARVRYVTTHPGVSATVFTWDYRPAEQRKDEIDLEFFSNEIDNGRNRPATNSFADAPIEGRGILELHEIPGLDMADFHDYSVAWTTDAVKWYVDGELIRDEFDVIPQHASKLRLNVWAPAANFVEAFDASLVPVPTDDPDRDLQVFEVDEVVVSDVLPGDTNGDRVVDINDLNNVRNSFGCEQNLCVGDAVPFDGLVNIDDLNAVRNSFGAGTTAAPEPHGLTIVSLLIFFGGVERYRRSRMM